jgi:hypothetical protein
VRYLRGRIDALLWKILREAQFPIGRRSRDAQSIRRLLNSALKHRRPSRYRKRDLVPLPLFEIARVLVRLDHVARFMVNANHSTCERLIDLAKPY